MGYFTRAIRPYRCRAQAEKAGGKQLQFNEVDVLLPSVSVLFSEKNLLFSPCFNRILQRFIASSIHNGCGALIGGKS
ncbi:MAG: hypothetical protein IH997_15395 [Proteobacteria bacterium]|nr:hypothetical protein [Pseudomonadota bacterium]